MNFTCRNCSKIQPCKSNTRNVFCDNSCQREHEWQTITKPRIERGEVHGDGSISLVRYIIERDGYRCTTCKVNKWYGEFLRLDVDHVDGNRQNNLPENLRLLCPNCHRQTKTWGNRSSGLIEGRIKKLIEGL